MTVKRAKIGSDGFAEVEGMISVYNYDEFTGEYTGETEEFLLVGVGIPANSTLIYPGEQIDGSATVFTGKKWKYVPDHRGKVVYSTNNGEPTEVSQLGDPPKNTTTIKPSGPYDVWDGSLWVTDESALFNAEVNAIESERQSKIIEANEYISGRQWPGKAVLGRLTENDIAQYNRWLDYLDSLECIKIESNQVPKWPAQPQKTN